MHGVQVQGEDGWGGILRQAPVQKCVLDLFISGSLGTRAQTLDVFLFLPGGLQCYPVTDLFQLLLEWVLKLACLVLNSGLATHWLCDLGHNAYPL